MSLSIRIKPWAVSVSGDSLFLGLQTLSSPCVLTQYSGEGALPGLSYQGTNPIREPTGNLITAPRPHLFLLSQWGLGFDMNFGRHTRSVPSNHYEVYSSLVWSTFTLLCNHHPRLSPEHFPIFPSWKELLCLINSVPIKRLPSALAATTLLPVSYKLTTLGHTSTRVESYTLCPFAMGWFQWAVCLRFFHVADRVRMSVLCKAG